MDDHRITVFLTAVHCGSFSRAARELYCSQSAVTQSIQSLENELGCVLIDRRHSGITLTAQGEALIPLFVEADRALKKVKEEAGELSEKARAPVRIGTYSSVANTFLPQLLKKYEEKVPGSSFQVRIGSDQLNMWLLEDEVDLILADEIHSKGARWYPLLEDPYMGVVTETMLKDPSQKSIRREDFFRLPFIMAGNNHYRTYLDVLPENRLDVVCDDDFTLVNMVSQGLGAALLPNLCILNPPDNIRILEIYPEFHRTIGLAVLSGSKPRIQRFRDFVLEEMQYTG